MKVAFFSWDFVDGIDPVKYEYNVRLYEELKKRGHEVIILDGSFDGFQDGQVVYKNGLTAADFDCYIIYGGMRKNYLGMSAKDHFKEFEKYSHSPNCRATAEITRHQDVTTAFLDAHGVPVPQTLISNPKAVSKKLSLHGLTPSEFDLPLRKTSFSTSAFDRATRLDGVKRFVTKPSYSSQGIDVEAHDTMDSAKEVLEKANKVSKRIVVQEMIETNNMDYRAYVIGDRVLASIRKTAADGDFRGNYSQGAYITPFEMSAAQEQDAIRAVQLCGLGYGSVDLMIDEKTGQHYVCEVNDVCSSMKTIEMAYPHINVAAEVAKYLEETYDPNNAAKASVKPEPKLLELSR